MDMSSSTTSSTAPASAPQNHQLQEAMVSSPIIKEEARSPKEAHATQQTSENRDRKLRPQLPEALRCPRCNSNNTKFCYYNNYSTTQPRYFCKACRRYWTHGGTLRNVPVGGGCRKNKRTSGSGSALGTSSSSSAYAQLSPGTNTSSSKMSINTQLMMVPNMTMPATTTTCLFPNVLPTLMSTGGGNDFDFTMDNQQVSLPFTPMPLSNQASIPMLTAGGSGTTPSFLEMLRRGFLHGSSSYDTSLVTSDDNNGMDIPFPLPSYGTMHGHGLSGPTTDGSKQMVGTQEGVNIGGGFAGLVGVQQQEEEEEGDTKAMVKSNNSNNGGSLLDRYWTKPNNNGNGSNKGQQG